MRRWLLWIFVCLFRPVLNALLSPTRSPILPAPKSLCALLSSYAVHDCSRRSAVLAKIRSGSLHRQKTFAQSSLRVMCKYPKAIWRKRIGALLKLPEQRDLKLLLAPPEVFGSQPQQHFRCLTKRCKRALPLQTSALSSATLPQARPKPSPSCAVILKLKLQTNGCLLKSALSPRSLPASQGFRDPPIAFPLPARLGAKPFWKAQGSFSPVEFGLL